MEKQTVLACHSWLPDGELARWRNAFPNYEFIEATSHPQAVICYGMPDAEQIPAMPNLRWIQLASAGVPAELCPHAIERKLTVTNLAGLYGPTIAEHALAMMLILSRNLHLVHRHQCERRWDRSVAVTMRDLAGKTLGIIGLGNIGQHIARLGRAHGMRVVGVRRRAQPTPFVDRVYDGSELRLLAQESDVIAVAAPLVGGTQGLLDHAFFDEVRQDAIFINVSRGSVADEGALLASLESGRLASAGLDVFAVEPLPSEHPFWKMPNVLVSPHYSGETVNLSPLPAQRFIRNLHNWHAQLPMEGVVHCEWGY